VRDAEFSLTPFYSPSLNELERGNDWEKDVLISLLSFEKEREEDDVAQPLGLL